MRTQDSAPFEDEEEYNTSSTIRPLESKRPQSDLMSKSLGLHQKHKKTSSSRLRRSTVHTFNPSLGKVIGLRSGVSKAVAMFRRKDHKVELRMDIGNKDEIPRESSLRSKTAQVLENEEVDDLLRVPKLNVVIMIVGTDGDVKPFIALGLQLMEEHGHRVRLATHEKFRKKVIDSGLEYYPLGGDPEKLASYSSSNRIIPTSFKEADEKLSIMREIIFSTYGACVKRDPKISAYKPPKENDIRNQPFTADAIISNPPTYGHIHCAESLGIPLHMFFTMPWTPTIEFCHPMAATLTGSKAENYLSYHAMNSLTWTGMRPIINEFRSNILNLKPIKRGENGGSLLDTNMIPFAYTWSPTLVPRPKDWHENCDVVGFFHSKGESNGPVPSWAKDRNKIIEFLKSGEPPIFFGFGSCTLGKTTVEVNLINPITMESSLKIVPLGDAVRSCEKNDWDQKKWSYTKENLHWMDKESRDDVLKTREEEDSGEDFFFNLTHKIIAAIKKTGKRAILQRGWGGLGYDKKGNAVELPDSMIAVGKEVHAWLFDQVAAVVHHGGAGTTAAGLLAGRPSMICSFCLDQPFWGAAVDKHRFGAPTKPVREVTVEDFVDAINNHFYNEQVIHNCKEAAYKMGKENGVDEGLKAFHKHLRRYCKFHFVLRFSLEGGKDLTFSLFINILLFIKR
jgi:hypothetical protein